MNTKLELTGLDGSNPLAFLAALGALRTLTLAWPERKVKMAWRLVWKWTPVLQIDGAMITREEVLAALHERLSNKQNEPYFALQAPVGEPENSLKKIPQSQYRRFAEMAAQQTKQPDWTDFAVAWGCEIKSRRKKDDIATTTDFDFTAGQQGLLQMVRQTIEETTQKQLEESLFQPWRYADVGLSLRWDLLDETRRYALQAVDPTNSRENPIKTMRGANRLAVEALPLFPVIPERKGVQTTGFVEINNEPSWTWPIWSDGLDMNVVRSVLANAVLYESKPDRARLRAQGIEEVYRSRVVMPAGYYRCFAPPQPA